MDTTVASVITLMSLLAIGISTLPTTWVCLFGLTLGFGMVLPASTTIILAVGSDAPGPLPAFSVALTSCSAPRPHRYPFYWTAPPPSGRRPS
ncbi:hypothetical protein ACFTZK_08205 [Streptomyces decoyicus]|uniref:hypothetical protein n=1 Tax=Streptomyces decoyicus TaxID=249567 RepID=UPI00363F98E5